MKTDERSLARYAKNELEVQEQMARAMRVIEKRIKAQKGIKLAEKFSQKK